MLRTSRRTDVPEWVPYVAVPVLAGIASYVGALAAVRTDISWIKTQLTEHTGEIRTLHSRINRLVERGKAS